MKYFLDQEFLEGFHKPLFGKSRHFIDLISIGIVAEDGREYYAVCREFDLDKAWKDEWIRNNVLKPLHAGMVEREGVYAKTYHYGLFTSFTKRSLKNLLRWQGKTRARISADIEHFCHGVYTPDGLVKDDDVQFYGYYADYDWVLFCSLFGRMIDLPKGFPMYCRDLKQMLDEKATAISQLDMTRLLVSGTGWETVQELPKETMDIRHFSSGQKIEMLKAHNNYPKQKNEHHALADARWNKELYNFLMS